MAKRVLSDREIKIVFEAVKSALIEKEPSFDLKRLSVKTYPKNQKRFFSIKLDNNDKRELCWIEFLERGLKFENNRNLKMEVSSPDKISTDTALKSELIKALREKDK